MELFFEGLHDATTSTLLPAGPVVFGIDSVDPEYVSPEKGTKGLRVECHVVDGVQFDDGTSPIGLPRALTFWHPHAGQKDSGKFCKGRINEFVQACGISTEGHKFETDDLIGKSFQCRVKIKESDRGKQEDYSDFEPYVF